MQIVKHDCMNEWWSCLNRFCDYNLAKENYKLYAENWIRVVLSRNDDDKKCYQSLNIEAVLYGHRSFIIFISISTPHEQQIQKWFIYLVLITSQNLGTDIAWCNFLICILLKYVGVFNHACRSPWPRSSVRATFASKFPAITKI